MKYHRCFLREDLNEETVLDKIWLGIKFHKNDWMPP